MPQLSKKAKIGHVLWVGGDTLRYAKERRYFTLVVMQQDLLTSKTQSSVEAVLISTFAIFGSIIINFINVFTRTNL